MHCVTVAENMQRANFTLKCMSTFNILRSSRYICTLVNWTIIGAGRQKWQTFKTVGINLLLRFYAILIFTNMSPWSHLWYKWPMENRIRYIGPGNHYLYQCRFKQIRIVLFKKTYLKCPPLDVAFTQVPMRSPSSYVCNPFQIKQTSTGIAHCRLHLVSHNW